MRPVYYIDPDLEYTVSNKYGPGPVVIEFSSRPNEVKELRKLRCVVSNRQGTIQFLVSKFEKLPVRPVKGFHQYRVEAKRIL